ncbi:MAG: PEP-CTERM sorting domain-containing protein, partial [Planctomycetota bacterium]
SPAFIESIDRITINSVFDDTSASIIELVPGSSASIGGAVTDPFNAPAGESLLLGTIEFTAGSIVGETTMLRATDLSMLDETVSGIGTPLDSVIQDGFASITVSAVPEPSVAPLLLAAGSIGLFRRRKKSRS